MFPVIYWIVYILSFPFCWFMFAGKEKMPKGSAVICANHTSWFDGVLIVLLAGPKKNFSIFAKAELFENKLVAGFLNFVGAIPVRRGKSDIGAIRKALETLKAGKKILIFPEGTRVKDPDSVRAKTGAAMLARKTDAPIVPVFITPGKKLFKKCVVACGDPIYPDGSYQEATDSIMESIRTLGKKYGYSGR